MPPPKDDSDDSVLLDNEEDLSGATLGIFLASRMVSTTQNTLRKHIHQSKVLMSRHLRYM